MKFDFDLSMFCSEIALYVYYVILFAVFAFFQFTQRLIPRFLVFLFAVPVLFCGIMFAYGEMKTSKIGRMTGCAGYMAGTMCGPRAQIY